MMGIAAFSGANIIGMGLMALIWIGLLVPLIWGIGRFLRHERHSEDEVAREMLGRRYAAGEITEAEYLHALRALHYD